MPVYYDNLNTGVASVHGASNTVYLSNINLSQLSGVIPPIPRYVLAAGPWRGKPDREIVGANNRRLNIKLNDPSELSFGLMGDSAEASDIHELVHSAWLFRDGVALHSGVLMHSNDSYGPTTYETTFRAPDWRERLRRIIITTTDHSLWTLPIGIFGDVLSGGENQKIAWNINTKPEEIIWELILHAQAQFNLGIQKSVDWGPTHVAKILRNNWVFNDGVPIWEAISRILRDNNFDFWIDPYRKAHVSDQKGSDKGAVLDLGGTVVSGSRQFDHDFFANQVRAQGPETATLHSYPNIGTVAQPNANGRAALEAAKAMPEGLWATFVSDSSLQTQEEIDRFGLAAYNRLNTLEPSANPVNPSASSNVDAFSYTVELASGAWKGLDHIDVGDTVRLVIKRGRLDVNHLMRVVSIDINIDQNNGENVSMTLNWPNDPVVKLRRLRSIIEYLNRR